VVHADDPLSRPQRRQLTRQVLGKAPADPARSALARDLADRMAVANGNLLLIFLGLVLTWTSQLLSGPTGWRLWLLLASLALWLLAVPWGLYTTRRTRRFLAEHPAPSADAE
jgi:fatty acid desaturase